MTSTSSRRDFSAVARLWTMSVPVLVLSTATAPLLSVSGWQAHHRTNSPSFSLSRMRASTATATATGATRINHGNDDRSDDDVPSIASDGRCTRRDMGRRILAASSSSSLSLSLLLLGSGMTSSPDAAAALVKGNAPPPKTKVSDKPKCTNVEECQALAEERERQEREVAAAEAAPVSTTPGGTRYRDIEEGTGGNSAALVAKEGDEVTIYYKVLKLGKRSYDGISGEGTVVFSRGYGLEDDESSPGVKSFTTVLGNYNNIEALNDAVAGMSVGSTRRFSILPQKGWRKPGRACDGGPGGSGTGGDLKTDYLVVPTATMVAEEACFDNTKQPFPTSYAQQRRMAQRFDQSLIMEVKLVSITNAP